MVGAAKLVVVVGVIGVLVLLVVLEYTITSNLERFEGGRPVLLGCEETVDMGMCRCLCGDLDFMNGTTVLCPVVVVWGPRVSSSTHTLISQWDACCELDCWLRPIAGKMKCWRCTWWGLHHSTLHAATVLWRVPQWLEGKDLPYKHLVLYLFKCLKWQVLL
jgi:hypothetical protein